MEGLLEVPLDELLAAARERRRGGGLVTYSPKVFIPLTTLCRDVCGYCTFARPPRRGERAFMTEAEVLAIARAGAAAGCTEALFTLGDKPELRYKVARAELAALGCETTLEYLARVAKLVLDETGLLPHLNPGVMSREELVALRPVSASMGIMLETVSDRLSAKGGPHWASPDKVPARRLETIGLAGELRIPFTSGILIGIGETRAERLEALESLRALHEQHGHLQEVIVQNFRAKPGTRMASHPEPSLDDHLWTIAAARLLLPADVAVQAPPNLAYDDFPRLLDAGIDDWGGVSPVTIDHVNPEAPWPDRDRLAEATRSRGLELAPRLPVYPRYLSGAWVDPAVLPTALRAADALGLAREDGWHPGETGAVPFVVRRDALPVDTAASSARRSSCGSSAPAARSAQRVFAAADRLRREVCGDEVSYVVTRNIQYTNVCYFRCGFCAFSKGKLAANLRGAPYLVPHDEIVRRAEEAWERGATEVCLQGGIHPAFTGEYYASVVEAIRSALPDLHIHAFSALEVWQGAETLGLPLEEYLEMLRELGLGSLPGTAAEILDDEVRAHHLPRQGLDGAVARRARGRTPRRPAVERDDHVRPRRAAGALGAASAASAGAAATVGRVHGVRAAAVRPHGGADVAAGPGACGPTFGESLLLHAVARLALHPAITNIQASWVKLGPEGVAAALRAGVNDLGGTLMNESISRSAGSEHGQEMPPEPMEALIRASGRMPRQRTTLYADAPAERRARRSRRAAGRAAQPAGP